MSVYGTRNELLREIESTLSLAKSTQDEAVEKRVATLSNLLHSPEGIVEDSQTGRKYHLTSGRLLGGGASQSQEEIAPFEKQMEIDFEAFHQEECNTFLGGYRGAEEVMIAEFLLPKNAEERLNRFLHSYETTNNSYAALTDEERSLYSRKFLEEYTKRCTLEQKVLFTGHLVPSLLIGACFAPSAAMTLAKSAFLIGTDGWIPLSAAQAIRLFPRITKMSIDHERKKVLDSDRQRHMNDLRNGKISALEYQENLKESTKAAVAEENKCIVDELFTHPDEKISKEQLQALLEGFGNKELQDELKEFGEELKKTQETNERFNQLRNTAMASFQLASLVAFASGNERLGRQLDVTGNALVKVADIVKSCLASGATGLALFGPAVSIGAAIFSVISVFKKQGPSDLSIIMGGIRQLSQQLDTIKSGIIHLDTKLTNIYLALDGHLREIERGQAISQASLNSISEQIVSLRLQVDRSTREILEADFITSLKEFESHLQSSSSHPSKEAVEKWLASFFHQACTWSPRETNTASLTATTSFAPNSLNLKDIAENASLVPFEYHIEGFVRFATLRGISLPDNVPNPLILEQGTTAYIRLLEAFPNMSFERTERDLPQIKSSVQNAKAFAKSLQNEELFTSLSTLYTQELTAFWSAFREDVASFVYDTITPQNCKNDGAQAAIAKALFDCEMQKKTTYTPTLKGTGDTYNAHHFSKFFHRHIPVAPELITAELLGMGVIEFIPENVHIRKNPAKATKHKEAFNGINATLNIRAQFSTSPSSSFNFANVLFHETLDHKSENKKIKKCNQDVRAIKAEKVWSLEESRFAEDLHTHRANLLSLYFNKRKKSFDGFSARLFGAALLVEGFAHFAFPLSTSGLGDNPEANQIMIKAFYGGGILNERTMEYLMDHPQELLTLNHESGSDKVTNVVSLLSDEQSHELTSLSARLSSL